MAAPESNPSALVEYGPLITAGAILLSATIASAFAYFQIKAHERIARRRATLDLLVQKEWDRDYIEAKQQFNLLRDAEAGLKIWSAPEHRNSPQLQNIRSTLNDYELIAIGIREGIIDEQVYKTWFRGSFLKDWEASPSLILEIRKTDGASKAYIQLEWLATKWGGSTAARQSPT